MQRLAHRTEGCGQPACRRRGNAKRMRGLIRIMVQQHPGCRCGGQAAKDGRGVEPRRLHPVTEIIIAQHRGNLVTGDEGTQRLCPVDILFAGHREDRRPCR